VRRAPVANEADLIEPLKQVVRAILREGSRFRLWANSPAHRLYTIRTGGWWSNVWKFVTTSEIQWGHGREPRHPTHQVVFFNWPSSVILRIKFVVTGAEAMRPGLVAELDLRTDAATHPRGDRWARLDRLFSRLIEILQPDFGHVLLPGHPDIPDPPNSPECGWLTYLSHGELTRPLIVPPPSVALPFAAGLKIIAATTPDPDEYAAVAVAITELRRAIPLAG